MKLLDAFETAHMTELQYLEQCYEQCYTYQDYVTTCELLNRPPMTEHAFDGHMEDFYFLSL